jgi:hypothetical protein
MKNCYFVRIPMRTAVISPPTLDGLLAYFVYQQTGDLGLAHEGLPLAKTDGVYHASSAIFENFFNNVAITHTGALKHEHIDHEMIKGSAKWGNTRQRDCGNVMSSYIGHLTQAIWYFFESKKPQEVEQILGRLTHLGKGNRKGWGQIDNAIELNSANVNGLVDSSGNPLRPIPMDKDFRVNPESIRADVTWRPAYWNHENSAPCFIMNKKKFTSSELEEFL